MKILNRRKLLLWIVEIEFMNMVQGVFFVIKNKPREGHVMKQLPTVKNVGNLSVSNLRKKSYFYIYQSRLNRNFILK